MQPLADSVLETNVRAIIAAQSRRLEECAYRTQRHVNAAQEDDEYDRLCAFVEMQKIAEDWRNGQLLCWTTVSEIDDRGLPIPPKDVLGIEGRKDATMWWECADNGSPQRPTVQWGSG